MARKYVGKPSQWQAWLQMGWRKETWAWWPPSVTMINPRWRFLMHSLPCINATCCDCSEEVHQHSLYPSSILLSPLSKCEHTLQGHFLCHIPTGLATSTQIAPLLWHRGGLASRRGRDGIESVSPFLRGSWQSSEEEHCLSDPISLLVPSLAPHPHQEEGVQMEEGLGFNPALKLLQDVNQVRAQLECEFVQETQELAWRYEDRWIKQARRYERQWAQMVEQTDATYQEVFSMVSSANSIKLLSWCISSTVPLHYMSGALATTTQRMRTSQLLQLL